MIHEIRRGLAHTFHFRKFLQGIQIVPDSATFKVFRGQTLVIESAATIGVDGTISCPVPSGYFSELFSGRVDMEATFNGQTFSDQILFQVTNFVLQNQVSEEELLEFMPLLRENLFVESGFTTLDGGTNFFISESLKSAERGFAGLFGELELSGGKKKIRVTGFDKVEGKIIFEPDQLSQVLTGTAYGLRDDFSTKIEQAFSEEVLHDIKSFGISASAIVDGNLVKRLVMYKAAENICRSKVLENKDRFHLAQRDMETKYTEALKAVSSLAVDRNGDGLPTVDENFPSATIQNIR